MRDLSKLAIRDSTQSCTRSRDSFDTPARLEPLPEVTQARAGWTPGEVDEEGALELSHLRRGDSVSGGIGRHDVSLRRATS